MIGFIYAKGFWKGLNSYQARMIDSSYIKGQERAAQAGFRPKTKVRRKVHFAWADGKDTKGIHPTNGKIICSNMERNSLNKLQELHFGFAHDVIYTQWAPNVTCQHCRNMMVKEGITNVLSVGIS